MARLRTPSSQCLHDVHFEARDRLNDKRSWIGRQAVKIVKELFNSPDYVDNPTAIAEYAQYATRVDGPALFGKPTPITHTDPLLPSYKVSYASCHYRVYKDLHEAQKPEDLYESTYVVKIMRPFMNYTKGSVPGFGRPVGALALTASAVCPPLTVYRNLADQISNSSSARSCCGTQVI